MKEVVTKSDQLQVIAEDKCPQCGCVLLVDRGIGYAIGELMIKWKYQCTRCKHQFYIDKDLSRY